ncbi:MAG: D-hexose-6-phosphate mutarotase [Kiritimatiellae bacterium]|nr:D-hexose-6-phosphate mutarotase [Kiritimatiellia bacterium]
MESTVKVINGKNNLPVVLVENDAATLEVYLHGAHITSYIPKATGKDLLWMSKDAIFERDKPIRGGIPICWPWFGQPNTKENPGANIQHGFARAADWSLKEVNHIDANTTAVTLALYSTAETKKLYPYCFVAELEIIVGPTLKLNLITHNTGSAPMRITQAMHTYFAIGDIAQTEVVGFDGVDYIDTVPGAPQINCTQSGNIAFNCEVDRIYENFSGTAVIEDKANSRKIIVKKSNSNTSVVWNPWIKKAASMADYNNDGYLTMVCVETCNITTDAQFVAPGESWTLSTELIEEAL